MAPPVPREQREQQAAGGAEVPVSDAPPAMACRSTACGGTRVHPTLNSPTSHVLPCVIIGYIRSDRGFRSLLVATLALQLGEFWPVTKIVGSELKRTECRFQEVNTRVRPSGVPLLAGRGNHRKVVYSPSSEEGNRIK